MKNTWNHHLGSILSALLVPGCNIIIESQTSPSGTSAEPMTMIRPGNSNSGRRALLPLLGCRRGSCWRTASNCKLFQKMWAKSLTQILSIGIFFWGSTSKRTEFSSISRGEMCNLGAFGATVSMTASKFIQRFASQTNDRNLSMVKFPREDDTKHEFDTIFWLHVSKKKHHDDGGLKEKMSIYPGAHLRGHHITNPNNALRKNPLFVSLCILWSLPKKNGTLPETNTARRKMTFLLGRPGRCEVLVFGTVNYVMIPVSFHRKPAKNHSWLVNLPLPNVPPSEIRV